MPTQKENQKEAVAKWMRRIAWSKEYRKPFSQSWKKSLELYNMHFGEKFSDDEDSFEIPFAFMHHSVKVPTIYTRMPKLIVKSTTKEDISTEDLIENVIADIFKKSGFEDELLSVSLNGVVTGTAIVKIGYKIVTDNVEVDENIPFDEDIHVVDKDGVLTEEIVTEHGIWVDMIDNNDFFFDPEAEKLESCRWVAHRITMTEERYKEAFPGKEIFEDSIEIEDGVKGKREYGNNIHMQEYSDSGDARRPVVYEIWDKEHSKYFIVAKGSDKFLKKADWIYDKLKKYPFEILTFDECLGSLYGLNKIYMQRDIIREKSLIKKRKVLNAKQCKATTLITTGTLAGDDETDAFVQAVDKGVLTVNQDGGIENIATPSLPAEAFIIDQELEKLMGDTSGTTPEIRQQESNNRETATQVETRNQNANIQRSANSSKFERFVERIAEKIIPILQEFYIRPEQVNVNKDANGVRQFVKWTGQDIGEYTFEAKVGSAAWQDIGLRTQQLNTMLQIVNGMIQSGAIPNPKPLLQKMLTRQFAMLDLPVEDIEEAFTRPELPIIPPGQGGVTAPDSQAQNAPSAQANSQGAGSGAELAQRLLQRSNAR